VHRKTADTGKRGSKGEEAEEKLMSWRDKKVVPKDSREKTKRTRSGQNKEGYLLECGKNGRGLKE